MAENKDLENRVRAFNAELIPLLGKYKLGLGSRPELAKIDNGGYVIAARPELFDDSNPKVEPKKEEDGLAAA